MNKWHANIPEPLFLIQCPLQYIDTRWSNILAKTLAKKLLLDHGYNRWMLHVSCTSAGMDLSLNDIIIAPGHGHGFWTNRKLGRKESYCKF